MTRPTHIDVRGASASDVDPLFELVSAFASSFAPERATFERSLRRLLSDEDCLLVVAQADGAVVGYLLGFVHDTFFANGPVCWIEELMVRDDVRRAGVGRSLVAQAEHWASSRGAQLVALASRRAEPFWTAVGYEASATYLRKLAPAT